MTTLYTLAVASILCAYFQPCFTMKPPELLWGSNHHRFFPDSPDDRFRIALSDVVRNSKDPVSLLQYATTLDQIPDFADLAALATIRAAKYEKKAASLEKGAQ